MVEDIQRSYLIPQQKEAFLCCARCCDQHQDTQGLQRWWVPESLGGVRTGVYEGGAGGLKPIPNNISLHWHGAKQSTVQASATCDAALVQPHSCLPYLADLCPMHL